MLFKKKDETNAVTVEAVLEALKDVNDPEIGRGLVELGMIKNVRACGGQVAFDVELTTPACPLKAKIEEDCRTAVGKLPGVTSIEISWSSRVPEGRKRERQQLPSVKHFVAIASGKGGVGKSTVSVNLAAALASSGASVGLLDADIYGPSIPLMMGIDELIIVEEVATQEGTPAKKFVPHEKYGVKLMSLGFMAAGHSPVMWRGPLVATAVRQLLFDTNWGELDYLIVDLPPGTGDAQISLSQLVPLTGAVIVMTPQDVALTIATKALKMFETLDVPILGIIENMSSFICPNCEHESEIFGHTGSGERAAGENGVRFLGRVPLDPRVVYDSDAGVPTVIVAADSRTSLAYRDIAAQMAAEISLEALRSSQSKAKPVEFFGG